MSDIQTPEWENMRLLLAEVSRSRVQRGFTPSEIASFILFFKKPLFDRLCREFDTELVNDSLDLAKVEAGQVTVRVADFEVEDLFSALRGMMRPLLPQKSPVSLIFEAPLELPTLTTDEGKVSQILRNLISNALKFADRLY